MARFAPGLSEIRGLLKRPYHDSVVRRAAILLALVVPAFGANMLVQFGAAALLQPDQFGTFYVANTISNVLFSGSLVLNMVFTRYLVSVEHRHGFNAIFVGLRRLQRVVLAWGALGAALCFALLWAFSRHIGMQSDVVILLVILDVYTAYVADLGRILLQSIRRTVPLGLYTLSWMILRFLFCMIGLLIFRTVWGGFIGIVASAVVMSIGLQIWSEKHKRGPESDVPPPPSLLATSPVAIGYALTITVSNLDVLMSYFLVDGTNLGIYSASSVFPKAIIVIVMPLLQMLFPIAMGAHLTTRQFRTILIKCALVLVAAAVCGSVATWALSDLLCAGRWGIRNCKADTLDVLLWSVPSMALLRGLVLLQFARGLDYLAMSLSIPTILYLWIAFNSQHTLAIIAKQFSLFSAAAFVFLAAVHLATQIRGSNVRTALGPSS